MDVPSCPAYNLPAEMLLEIFNHICEPPKALGSPPKVGNRESGPLLLGSVCRQWRDIVWSSPTLWTYIHLILSRNKCAVQTKLLDEYLRRSNGLPLTVVFRKKSTGGPYEYEDDRTLPLYKLIAKESHRWEAIDIFIPYFCISRMNHTCVNLPLLRTAFVEVLRQEGYSLIFIQNATNLRELGLDFFLWPRPKNPLSYRHLTHFRASKLYSDQVLEILGATHELRSCFIEDIIMESWWTSVPPVHLKNLEYLTILNSSCSESNLLEHILSVPVLREFKCGEVSGEYLPLEDIMLLLDRSPSCQLQTLELRANLFGQDTDRLLERLLRRTTTISRLVLYFKWEETLSSVIGKLLNPNHDQVPTGAIIHNDHPVLLPDLEHLELQCLNTDSLPPVIDLIKYRWVFGNSATAGFASDRPQSSAKQFAKIASLRLPGWCSATAMEELRDEVRGGLAIDFF
ncbi:hypothetical protein GALMADRAFT_246286 [Galerina marginata CBS 339.88]|uniref:Uncharacterized protein n=1 Tax=Galerina marginata (strain CBS 339.88) TaxID=685588 RepID=A0A067T1N5_GALM3|nr:hypothetical protein GALMADRAFT_246286 [Galerina marginata CBS 339.88]